MIKSLKEIPEKEFLRLMAAMQESLKHVVSSVCSGNTEKTLDHLEEYISMIMLKSKMGLFIEKMYADEIYDISEIKKEFKKINESDNADEIMDEFIDFLIRSLEACRDPDSIQE